MGSNRLLSSSVHGHISGQASRGYTCTEKYEWQHLTLHQNGKTGREQPHHVATLNCPLHISSRIGEYTASHGHGHPSEIRGPGNGGGPCHLSCCSYGSYHGQDHACFRHSSKRARRSISPGPGPIRSNRSKQSPSFDCVHHYAKGADRQINQAVSFRENFPVNQGSGSQNRHYHEDKYLLPEVDLPNSQFSEIDAARHCSYMSNFHAFKKHEGHSWEDPRTSHGSYRQRDEEVSAYPERPVDKFRGIYREQPLSPSKNIHERLESSRNCRNAYNGRMLKRKCIKQGVHKNTYNGACAGKYGRKSNWKRNADQLGGNKAWKNVVYEDKSERFSCPNEQDQQLHVESKKMRNDSREGNAEITKLVGRNEAKGNCNPEKNAPTAHASSISTKCEENLNMLSPKYSSKTIASSNGPKLSDRSNNMEPESGKQSNVDCCTERGILQHLPVINMEKCVQRKESAHSEVLRDCLNIWRRLRKDSGAEVDKTVKTDQQQTVKTSRVSVGGRVTNVRTAACYSSESDDEDDSALESSELSSTAMSSEGRKKSGEGKVDRKLEWPLQCPSSHKCNKSTQNTTAEKGLMCHLELPPEAKRVENVQQKEQDHSSTDRPGAKMQTTWHDFSDTSKVDQAAVSHRDNSAHQDVPQEADNDSSDERRKDKLGIRCEMKKKTEGGGAELVVLDQKTVTSCSMHANLKVNTSEYLNHDSGSTTIDGSILNKETATKCRKKLVNRSSGSYCRDVKNWFNVNDCKDIQQETMNCNILRKKQDFLVLADSENEMNHEVAKEDCQAPQALGVGATSNQQMSHRRSKQQMSHQCASDTVDSCTANQGDRAPCSLLPDLNCLPSMISDEDFIAPEEPVCQATADGFKPQCVPESVSVSLTGPVMEEEQFKQVEPNQIGKEVCVKGTSESANQFQISDSNTRPPQLSTVEESSTSTDAFKLALCEFMRNILKPLWEDGLLSREVYKLIMNKAAAKVIGALVLKVPSTEVAISKFISNPDESRNLEKLVQGYLDVYVGRQVLKRTIPGSS